MTAKKTNPATPHTDHVQTLLAKRLRDWRKATGVPLKHVAEEFNVSAGTWSRWEKGSRFPKPHYIPRLAKYIRVPICEFFYLSLNECTECHLAQNQQPKP
jgi:transcriptional regulator with XRE-family HTH domain